MAGMNGIETARVVQKKNPDIPIIFHTAFPGDYAERDIDASERPFDYVEKLENGVRLDRAIRNAVKIRALNRNQQPITQYAEEKFGMIGESAAMQEAFNVMKNIAPADSPVLLTGETGTGKRTAAMAIHNNSPRGNKNFVVFQCSPLDDQTFDKVFLGQTKEQGIPQDDRMAGILAKAEGGTLYLEEVENLDLDTQAKLQYLLEPHRNIASASDGVFFSDVRLISSSKRNLESLVKSGGFREDLYYFLKGVQITFPPLKERREDIPLLVDMIKSGLSAGSDNTNKTFDPEAIKIMCEYDWPGNIRQLKNTVSGLIHLTSPEVIRAQDVIAFLRPESGLVGDPGRGLTDQVRNFEKSRIMETLERNSFNISAAARELLMDRANLRKKIKYYNITFPK